MKTTAEDCESPCLQVDVSRISRNLWMCFSLSRSSIKYYFNFTVKFLVILMAVSYTRQNVLRIINFRCVIFWRNQVLHVLLWVLEFSMDWRKKWVPSCTAVVVYIATTVQPIFIFRKVLVINPSMQNHPDL